MAQMIEKVASAIIDLLLSDLKIFSTKRCLATSKAWSAASYPTRMLL